LTVPPKVQRALDAEALKFLAGCKGPCITMLIPGHHPGAQEGSRQRIFRNMVRAAAEQLRSGKLAGQAADLIGPLEAFPTEELENGGPGVAIFRSPEVLATYLTFDQPGEKLVIGSHFYLAPLAARGLAPQRFFVLGIGRNHLRLFRCLPGECEEIALPAGVPESLEAAGAFDQPDHDLQGRSAAGSSIGNMRGVSFGTLSDREAAPQYLAHYLGLVDQGLKDTLAGAPLVLAGVWEEIAAYRKAARYPNILENEIVGNIEFLSAAEVGGKAVAAVAEHQALIGGKVLAGLRELTNRSRVLEDLHAIVRAAGVGRVHRLCVRAGTEITGPLPPDLDTAHAANEDLVNAAVVETLRAGGEVFTVAQDRMTATGPVAAILRY